MESYAQHLISEKKRALVAAYCAHLTAPRRVALYSRLVLSMVHDLPRVTSGGNVNTQLSSYNASEFDYRSGMSRWTKCRDCVGTTSHYFSYIEGGSALTVFDSTARSRVLSVAVPSEVSIVGSLCCLAFWAFCSLTSTVPDLLKKQRYSILWSPMSWSPYRTVFFSPYLLSLHIDYRSDTTSTYSAGRDWYGRDHEDRHGSCQVPLHLCLLFTSFCLVLFLP